MKKSILLLIFILITNYNLFCSENDDYKSSCKGIVRCTPIFIIDDQTFLINGLDLTYISYFKSFIGFPIEFIYYRIEHNYISINTGIEFIDQINNIPRGLFIDFLFGLAYYNENILYSFNIKPGLQIITKKGFIFGLISNLSTDFRSWLSFNSNIFFGFSYK